jgi:hypothetical protein
MTSSGIKRLTFCWILAILGRLKSLFFWNKCWVKAEDFDYFDDLRQGEGLRSDYLREVKIIFLKHSLKRSKMFGN